MTEEMKFFIKAIETTPNGRLHILEPDDAIALYDLDTAKLLYAPNLKYKPRVVETLFLIRVERALTARGWDWT